MNHDAARNERLVLYFDVARHQDASSNDGVIGVFAIMRDVAGRYDVVVIADLGNRLRLGTAGYRVVLADDVAAADAQVAALTREVLVERIGPQHGAGGNGIPLAHRRPALHVDVRFEQAILPDGHVGFNHAELPDAAAGANRGVGMYTR